MAQAPAVEPYLQADQPGQEPSLQPIPATAQAVAQGSTDAASATDFLEQQLSQPVGAFVPDSSPLAPPQAPAVGTMEPTKRRAPSQLSDASKAEARDTLPPASTAQRDQASPPQSLSSLRNTGALDVLGELVEQTGAVLTDTPTEPIEPVDSGLVATKGSLKHKQSGKPKPNHDKEQVVLSVTKEDRKKEPEQKKPVQAQTTPKPKQLTKKE